jgi:uncharacterized protein (TIGR02284 family)
LIKEDPMNTSNEKAIHVLNDLIEVCKDGAQGFSSAAEGVQDAGLKTLFTQYATERSHFVSELQQEVENLGGKPQDSGSVAGAMHRGWIDLKAAVTGKNDHAILSECERGEDVAKDTYQKAIEELELPGHLLPLVQRQAQSIKSAHDRVRDLRDSRSMAA